MVDGTIIIVGDLVGFYVGMEGIYVKVDDGKKIHKVVIPDDISNHVIANPFAIAHIFYTKLVALAKGGNT